MMKSTRLDHRTSAIETNDSCGHIYFRQVGELEVREKYLLLQHKRPVVERCGHLWVLRTKRCLPNLGGPRKLLLGLGIIALQREETTRQECGQRWWG